MALYDRVEPGSYGNQMFPSEYGYGSVTDGINERNGILQANALTTPDEKPRILLMGLRRSGKSSIQKVVFHKMSPNETLFLESTNKIEKDDVSDCSFIKFQIWDIPGHIDYQTETFDYKMIFGLSCAIIFVIDAQDDYLDALAKLSMTIQNAYKVNPQIKFEVFIHKVDCLNDDQRIDIQRDITQRANDELVDAGLRSVSIGFYLTTIYDHSIFESFSKVVQKLIPYMGSFENLLNIFITNSMLEKAFLFDVASKIYLATDSNPVDMQTYELCCDMIDVVVDMATIYNQSPADPAFSEETASVIRLNNDTVLYLRGVNKYLALVCLMRDEAMDKQGIIDYNFQCIKKALQDILDLVQKAAMSNQKWDTEESNEANHIDSVVT